MKFTNRLLAMLLCIVMLSAVACLSVSAITLLPVGNWVYHEINNNTEIEIYDYTGANETLFTPYSHNLLPITTVGMGAFNENTTLQKITLSKYITTVSDHAFQNCTALNTVLFQDKSVKAIGNYAFAGCSSLSDISLEDTLIETVSDSAFMNCDSLTEVTLPSTVTTIEDNAFAYCDNLRKVTIPKSATVFKGNAFSNSPNVVIYCYKDSVAHEFAFTYGIDFVLIDDIATYILGDADNDGIVSVIDATVIQFVLAKKADKPDGYDVRSDVDKDGVVSVMDATTIQLYVAGLLDDTSNIGKSFEY